MIVLDTHAVIWLAEAPEELSPLAVEAIKAARKRDGLAISDKTLWELAMMISRGRVSVTVSIGDFLEAVERNFTVLPITAKIAERSVRFSTNYSSDPSDRIIGATAVVHGLCLITKDGSLRASGEVNCVW